VTEVAATTTGEVQAAGTETVDGTFEERAAKASCYSYHKIDDNGVI